jgi:hypothetical protein
MENQAAFAYVGHHVGKRIYLELQTSNIWLLSQREPFEQLQLSPREDCTN